MSNFVTHFFIPCLIFDSDVKDVFCFKIVGERKYRMLYNFRKCFLRHCNILEEIHYLEHAQLIRLFKVKHIMVMVCMFGRTHGG